MGVKGLGVQRWVQKSDGLSVLQIHNPVNPKP